MARRGRPRNTEARGRVVAAATELFLRYGFLATTIGDIAEAAEVSVQTIYSAHGSKVGVLAAGHDIAVAGDDEPVPLAQQQWFRDLDDEPSATAAWAAALDRMYLSTVRVAPLYRVMLAAEADSEVAGLMSRLRAQRAEFSRLLADRILARPGAESADAALVGDLIYATECVESYSLLVVECGWPVERWRQWVLDTVGQHLG